MSSSSRRSGARGYRPTWDNLEGRTLLSKVLSGTDVDGDRWVLRLVGPGDVASGQPDRRERRLRAAGRHPHSSTRSRWPEPTPSFRAWLVPSRQAEGGDGRVYFQNMAQLNGKAVGVIATVGIHVIDMPDFWLGRTSTAADHGGTPSRRNRRSRTALTTCGSAASTPPYTAPGARP